MKIRAAMAIISCFVSCLFAVSTVADEIGFLSPIVGSNPGVTIAGVKSGGAPWVVSHGFAVLNDEGRLRVDLRGLKSLLGLAMLFSLSASVRAQDQGAQVIEGTAKKYEYSNSPIHVKIGTKVQLKITATDHDHGFKIAAVPDGAVPNGTGGLIFTSPQDCWQLKKGETTTIEFFAQTPGTYSFKCCHTCGLGHRGMKGQIVVE